MVSGAATFPRIIVGSGGDAQIGTATYFGLRAQRVAGRGFQPLKEQPVSLTGVRVDSAGVVARLKPETCPRQTA